MIIYNFPKLDYEKVDEQLKNKSVIAEPGLFYKS